MFVLLMFFLFKYIDDLIGKGFEWYVIVELLWYASATNVAMALPLAILLSSIMTFGSLGENYELVAIKSAGLSLQKAMMPLFITVSFLSAGAFLFSDYMLPVANLKMLSRLYDIRMKKADFLIEEGIFNNSISDYSIRVQKKGEGNTLYDILIYDHTGGEGNSSTILAKEGSMYISNNKQSLMLRLKDGVRYEETSAKGKYDPRQQFMRYRFKETEQRFDLSPFSFQRTDESLFKSYYVMLNLRQLIYNRDSIQVKYDSVKNTLYPKLKFQYRALSPVFNAIKQDTVGPIRNYGSILELFPTDRRDNVLLNAQESVRQSSEMLTLASAEYDAYKTPIIRTMIEYHRKFTLSFSCLLLFSIGAPLGAIIRKGGLGLPVVMSVLFFLIYHIISTIGEKSAKEGSITPMLGMWIAIIILAPLAIFLTYKATVDSTLLDIDSYKQAIQKFFKRKKRE
jgi:lipopolysaccharide export system permease protein